MISVVILSCSDDSSDTSVQDDRLKLIFDMNGSGAIIGDKSNTVLKRLYTNITTNVNVMTSNFSFNPNSRNFYFPARSLTSNEIVLHKANALNILNSEEFYYQTTEIPILSDQEQFLKAFVNWEDDVFVIYRNASNTTTRLKKLSSGQLIYTQGLSNSFGIGADFQAFHLVSINKLVLVDEWATELVGVVLDLANKDNVQQFTLPDHINLFNVVNDGNDIYFIGKQSGGFTAFDTFYDIDGNKLSTASNFIATSALGYDVEDAQIEYVERGDGRNEAGTINVTTGELDFLGIAGEPGFHRSRLFFFNR